jgi:hypothetical protein
MHNCASLRQRIAQLRAERSGDARALAVLDALQAYADELCASPVGPAAAGRELS